MKFRYAPYIVSPSAASPNKNVLYRPVIRVRFRGPHSSCQVRALLDTGADESYITETIAAELGITPIARTRTTVHSASGTMSAWYGNLSLELADHSEKHCLSIIVGVIPDEWPEMILGHIGFFEYFEATFSHANKIIALRHNRS